MAQGIVEIKYFPSFYFKSNHGHEGHEEEGCQQDCQGQNGQVCGFPWNQGKDPWWLDQVGFGAEQARKDCDQEASCSRQEGVRQQQGLDSSSPEGKEGTECEGLRRCQEGYSSLQ